jgi:hypothetical protein
MKSSAPEPADWCREMRSAAERFISDHRVTGIVATKIRCIAEMLFDENDMLRTYTQYARLWNERGDREGKFVATMLIALNREMQFGKLPEEMPFRRRPKRLKP